MRVDVLVFSRDRPAQLELLLRSANLHARDVYRSVEVLYFASAAPYAEGYGLVSRQFPYVRFHAQLGFQAAVEGWLEHAGEVVSFLCDDDVFYRDAPAPNPTRLPLSYRGGDYDYPFSVDGNVYLRSHVLRLLRGLEYGDPSQLEAAGDANRGRLPFAEVYPCEPACLVGVPLNRVSPSSGMPHADVDPRMLNEFFLAGHRLTIPPAGDYGAHELLELELSEPAEEAA